MDRSRHARLRAGGRPVRPAARARLYGGREARGRQLRAGEDAAARRRAGGAAPADRRRLSVPGPATESLRGGTAPLELRPGLPLPELDAVHWRKPLDAPGLRLRERVSAAYTVIYCTPLIAAGLVLIALQPLLAPV